MIDARDIPPCVACRRVNCVDPRECTAEVLAMCHRTSRRSTDDVRLVRDDLDPAPIDVNASAPTAHAAGVGVALVALVVMWCFGQALAGEPGIPIDSIPPSVYAPAPTD